MYLNCRGVDNKKLELFKFIRQHKIHIILLNETHLKSTKSFCDSSTPGTLTNLFVDDTMFMATSIGMQHAVDKLQLQIDITLPWLKSWKLTLDTDKILAIKFGGRGLKSTTSKSKQQGYKL